MTTDRCDSCGREIPRGTMQEVFMCWDWAWCDPCRRYHVHDVTPGADVLAGMARVDAKRTANLSALAQSAGES